MKSVEEMVALGGGTPFYLKEMVRSLESGATTHLPDHLAGIVAGSFAALPNELREGRLRSAGSDRRQPVRHGSVRGPLRNRG